MMIFVSLSDGFGRRLMMITSLVIFGVGSVICAVAHTYHVLIAGRTVQGFGGGGLLALNVVLVTDLVPLKARGGFYGIISIVYAIGSVTGPVIGGALATEGQWRWIFWLNVPIVGVALVGIILFLKLSQRNGSFAEKLRGIDYIGFVLFGASLTSFLISITWGGIQYAWSSWQTLLPLILGAVGLITFVLYERYLAKNPFVPMGIFINYTVCILFAGSFVHGVILYAIAYYMPEYYLSAKSYTPVISGVAALPQTATLVPSAGVVGFLVDKTGRYRAIMWVGWALTTLGVGLLTYLDIDISVPGWIFLTAVSGLGLGVLFPVQELALQASVEPESVAMSATMVLFFRSLGQAVGVAIGSTILEDRMQVELAKPYLADILPASLQGLETIELIGVIRTLPAHSALANAIKVGLVRSFQIIWAVVCALSGVAMICHFVMREYSMDQEHITDQGYRQESDTRQQSEANADREK